MYRVVIAEAYGSGAGYLGTPANKFMTIRGYGFSKSVQSAIRQAGRDVAIRADKALAGVVYVPVLREMSIYRGAKLVARQVL